MQNRIAIIILIIVFSFKSGYSQKMDWFNHISSSPQLFGSGIISDESGNRDMAISPNGNELMYTLQYKNGTFSTIIYSKKSNGKWSSPEIISFSGRFNDLEPAYSPDGKRIYFSSNRPIDDSNKSKDYDIWYSEKINGTIWSNPIHLDSMVNTSKNEFYPSIGKSGSIYFTREMEGKDEDIVSCQWNENHFEKAVSLPETINSNGAEFNAYVDADESMILFTAYKKPSNFGQGDIYVSFKSIDGTWLPSKNLGNKINDKGLTYCPYISPDKKYFFFTSNRWSPPPFAEKQNIKSLKKLLRTPLNGWDNIYWLDAKEIFNLK